MLFGTSSLRSLGLSLLLLILLVVLSVCGAQSIQPSVALPSVSDDMFDMPMMDTETFMSATQIDFMSSADVMPSSIVLMTAAPTPSPSSDVTSAPPSTSTPVMDATPSASPVETPFPSPDVTATPPPTSTPALDVTETPTSPPEVTTPSSTTPQTSSSGLGQGVIIGIAAGGGVGVLLLIVLVLCCCCCCCCCKPSSTQEYTTGNEGFRPHIVVRTYNQNVERAGSLISRGSRGSLARSSISSIASSLRRLSGKRRSKNKESHFVNEEAVAMKVTPL